MAFGPMHQQQLDVIAHKHAQLAGHPQPAVAVRLPLCPGHSAGEDVNLVVPVGVQLGQRRKQGYAHVAAVLQLHVLEVAPDEAATLQTLCPMGQHIGQRREVKPTERAPEAAGRRVLRLVREQPGTVGKARVTVLAAKDGVHGDDGKLPAQQDGRAFVFLRLGREKLLPELVAHGVAQVLLGGGKDCAAVPALYHRIDVRFGRRRWFRVTADGSREFRMLLLLPRRRLHVRRHVRVKFCNMPSETTLVHKLTQTLVAGVLFVACEPNTAACSDARAEILQKCALQRLYILPEPA